ncbi:breast cancer anti-estrogen resistance protein 3 isoform X2 [Rhinatrema bivittatum]|nr:breast cancer anti-estrogen resistance protein 3 isoform X2 [Rhinatrema bivittatum]
MIAAGKFTALPGNMQMSHQFPLASSMDLLSTKAPLPAHHSDAYQDVSIHGTLPRKKKGPVPISHMGTLPYSKTHRLPAPLIRDVIEECPPHGGTSEKLSFRDQSFLSPTMEYVKFSKGKYTMETGTPEKLRKELEDELKLSSEDLRSHAWYHGCIPRQVSESLLQRDGDFLIRDSLSSPGNFVLTCQWKNTPHHFRIHKVAVRLNEACCRVQYQFERESFDTVPALVRYYVGNRKPVSEQSGAVVFQPINRSVPLRCTEERYITSPMGHKEGSDGKMDTLKRHSLGICKGQAQEQSLSRGNLLRNKEKSGSQPASLDHVQDRRRPLKAHQSESYLPIGSRHSSQISGTEAKLCPRSPVFRTGSEPTLSPTTGRRFTYEAPVGEALRGSDSQLCPKPPPKPSKVPSMKTTPPSPASWHSPETNYCELNPADPIDWEGTRPSFCLQGSPVEHQTASEKTGRASLRNSDMSYLNLDSEDSASQSSGDASSEQDEHVFAKPVYETESSFRPNEFESPLLLPENKPLEMLMLRRAKELFTNNHPRIIAKHILKVDCKVARILEVSAEMRKRMGVSSGLELITLPYGHQLRLDIIERHSTMAIGIAVDILGCTGNLEERVATLNKIIQVAVELKDSMGDLYAFSAIMKALDMHQITRLEQTWTSLRHQYTQTAIIYEKQLKPFSKALHEGRAAEGICAPQTNVTVPLLMPLVTLLERQTVIFEGLDMWENNDRGCEIMLNHLEASRLIAQNADRYRTNAERILEGFSPDDEMSDVFKTEFQMRLLWGSKGAQVNQPERYQKFNQILTALSRKLEPPQT